MSCGRVLRIQAETDISSWLPREVVPFQRCWKHHQALLVTTRVDHDVSGFNSVSASTCHGEGRPSPVSITAVLLGLLASCHPAAVQPAPASSGTRFHPFTKGFWQLFHQHTNLIAAESDMSCRGEKTVLYVFLSCFCL